MIFRTENSLRLTGEVADTPVFSHETHETRFFRLPLDVMRLSCVPDHIPVLVREELLRDVSCQPGDFITLGGELRSFNNKSGVGSRLVITAFARELSAAARDEFCNELHLCGALCKPPIYRKTPLGREICDLMLAINRRYGRADYIPCIAWGKNAHAAKALCVSDRVMVNGRVQSREYIKTLGDTSETRTTYEVSVAELTPVSD